MILSVLSNAESDQKSKCVGYAKKSPKSFRRRGYSRCMSVQSEGSENKF